MKWNQPKLYISRTFLPVVFPFGPSIRRLCAEHPDIPARVAGGNLIARSTSLLWMRMREPGHEVKRSTSLEELFFEEDQDLFSADCMGSLAKKWKISDLELTFMAADPSPRAKVISEMEDVATLLGGFAAFPTIILRRGDKNEMVSQEYVDYDTAAGRFEAPMHDLRLEPMAPHARMSTL